MVRWTAPVSGTYDIHARFDGVDSQGTTTDVNVFLNSSSVFTGSLGVGVAVGDLRPGGRQPQRRRRGVLDGGLRLQRRLLRRRHPSLGHLHGHGRGHRRRSCRCRPDHRQRRRQGLLDGVEPQRRVWTYGWEPSLGGTFGNDTYTGQFISGVDEYSSGTQYLSIWHNHTSSPITSGALTFQPGKVVLHPGPAGEYSVVRWTAPAAGSYEVSATFTGVDGTPTTTDVHVLQNNVQVFAGDINVSAGNSASYTTSVALSAGATLDFAVGNGGNGYFDDGTQLDVSIVGTGF